MKAIQLAINEVLPEELRDYNRVYNKNTLNDIQAELAVKYPEQYGDIVNKIMAISRDSIWKIAPTLTLNDFRPVFDKKSKIDKMMEKARLARKTIKDKKKRDEYIKHLYEQTSVDLEKDTYDAAVKSDKVNNLFNAVSSGARGNKTQLKAIVTTPGVYTDYKGETIPIFSRKSYGEGISLPSYLASTYGTRNSTVQIKKGTATAGGVGKELNRAVTRMVINGIKDLSDNGIDLDIDDDSLHGRVLAREAAGFKPGTVVDRNVLNELREKGIKKVIVHSPIATISAEGIPAEAFGLDYNRMLPSVGDHVGLQASTALSEPMIQGSLCLVENTEVRMADGSIKQIKDIKPGDWVLGADKEGNHFPVEVKNVFNQGYKHAYRYGFKTANDYHTFVESTQNHKYLVEETIEEDEQD